MGIFAFSNRLPGTPSSFCLSACFYAIPNFEVAATFHLLPVKKIKKTNQKKKIKKTKNKEGVCGKSYTADWKQRGFFLA